MQGSLSPDRRYRSEIRVGHSRHQAPDASPQASESYLENTFLPLRTAKTFEDATVGQDFQQTQFRFGFGATINTLRISLIVCVVGKVLGAVEDENLQLIKSSFTPEALQALATLTAPSRFTVNANSELLSHPSTSV